MTAKDIAYDVDARNRLLHGLDQLADAVSVTLGPRGRTVILDEATGPFATKDGVTVAKAITLRNRMENAGAQLVRDVAGQTNDDVGDGTTSAIVMARELARRGAQAVAMGVNATEVRRGMADACSMVVSELQRQAQPVGGKRVEQVATIAANGDAEIGRLLSQAFERVGDDGAVSVEQGEGTETVLDVRQGMQVDSGYLSAHFVTDNERLVCEFDTPRVLLSAEKISSTRALLPFLEATAQNNEALLIVADEIDGDALTTLAVNAQRAGLKVCAIKAPGYGERRRALLDDLAAVTGATVVRRETGVTLDAANTSVLGQLAGATVFRDRSVLIGADASDRAAAVAERCREIRAAIANSDDRAERERLHERLAALAGGVAVIKVAGVSEAEVRERKDRVDDAVHAVRAALAEGIVAGGGAALLHAAVALDGRTGDHHDQALGIQAVLEALTAPARRIAENAGFSGNYVVSVIRENGDPAYGFDARTGEYGDMFAAQVVDPVKVVRSALANAVSVAGAIVTTEAAIAERQTRGPAAAEN